MPTFAIVIFFSALLGLSAMAAPDSKSIEAAAHDAYADAINSNDIEKFTAILTDDVVFQSPGEPDIVGEAAVRAWATAYLESSRTHWKTTPISFTVNGDWAFERYHYETTDTDRKTGVVSHDTGKGTNVFRRGVDGRWRVVAIDDWSSDKPSGT